MYTFTHEHCRYTALIWALLNQIQREVSLIQVLLSIHMRHLGQMQVCTVLLYIALKVHRYIHCM